MNLLRISRHVQLALEHAHEHGKLRLAAYKIEAALETIYEWIDGEKEFFYQGPGSSALNEDIRSPEFFRSLLSAARYHFHWEVEIRAKLLREVPPNSLVPVAY